MLGSLLRYLTAAAGSLYEEDSPDASYVKRAVGMYTYDMSNVGRQSSICAVPHHRHGVSILLPT